ncbi:rhodanese-like domain-containing protein [Flagellimonas allohymeniacidonis]|uniref:Rhodanese-like domain-containing protein n=1 Tax=Flagellimonas allohymeniacidonis TaxID=2517819 RepID=A0A4Q8QCC7_9FLAO|nr:rhodanese-like domain-containing protein [Allomuricauda hymeniacidonis]TAI48025.1 rhodanese-like domain-containing protein [Allomuricauda hymeniacidonis]
MRYVILFALFSLLILRAWTQSSIPEVLDRFNSGSVEYIFPETLAGHKGAFLLDTREKEEFATSHLKDAQWVGYEDFDLSRVKSIVPNKNTPIVVYCSVGVRSEDIGEQLKEAGYSNVKNLYGGIFQWKNEGHPVYNSLQKETQKVHAYSKFWGKLLTNAEKIYSFNTETLEPKEP